MAPLWFEMRQNRCIMIIVKLRIKMRKDNNGIAHLAIIIVIVVIAAVAGTGAYVYRRSNSKTASKNVAKLNSDFSEPIPTNLVPIDDIQKTATASTDLTVLSAELKKEDGKYIYVIKLSNGTTVYFDAQTGTKIDHSSDDSTDDTDEKKTTSSSTSTIKTDDDSLPKTAPTISYARAREIALAQKPGGTITKIELDNEDGKTVYKVQFSDEARYYIDANTGSIVKSEPGKTENEKEDEKDD